MGLNNDPMYTPNPTISFFVTCETADEIEHAWKSLTDGGSVLMPLDRYPWSEKYGWLQDRFGVSWQVVHGKVADVGRKFAPALMFTGDQAGRAEEAIRHYASVFEPSSIGAIARYGPGEHDKEGTIKHARFRLGEQVLVAMDSSLPHAFSFSEGVSLVVTCPSQREIDHYWSRLTEGGQESMCGWLEDRFGVSWQVVPAILGELMGDPARAPRVMEALMKLKKLDVEKLSRA